MQGLRLGPWFVLAFGFLLSLPLSCSDNSTGTGSSTGTKVVDPETTGSLKVSVRFSGAPIAPRELNMSSAPECVRGNDGPVFEEVLALRDGSVQNAVVWIDKGLEEYSFQAPTNAILIDQKGCMYNPHVAAVMVGQPLEYINSDPTAHNVHGFPKVINSWNFIMSRKGSKRSLRFSAPEVAVTVGCDIHAWMRSYVAVIEHPYFGVSSEEGIVEIEGLPAGDYVVAAWHEKLGRVSRKVTIAAMQRSLIEIPFSR